MMRICLFVVSLCAVAVCASQLREQPNLTASIYGNYRVGNDQMIEAPHAGAFVRYASIWRSDILPYGGRP